jgi:methanogenic corrinoid protein MtbC1
MADEDAAARTMQAGSDAASHRAGAAPVTSGAPAAHDVGDVVEQALTLTRALDALALDDMLRRAIARLGVPAFLDAVALPMVRHVDQAWRTGALTIAQERLAASTVHDLLVETMRALARGNGTGRLVLATAPGAPGDRYGLGTAAVEAAAAGAAAAADGWEVVYLGPDLPAGEIAAVAAATAARAVAVHIAVTLTAADDRERAVSEVRALRARLPAAVPVLVSGVGAPALAAALADPGIHVGASWAELRPRLRPGPGPDVR